MGNNGLVKAEPRALGRLRLAWLSYKGAHWAWHIVAPAGLATVAGLFLTWAWQVLGADEYLVALLLTLFFLIVGIGAVAAIPKGLLRIAGFVVVVSVAAFSASVIWIRKGDKPWSNLLSKREQVVKTVPQPTVSPVEVRPAPIMSPSPLATAIPTNSVTPTPSITPIATATPTPMAATTPEPRPSPVSGPSIGPKFGAFMGNLTPLHKGYKTHHILSPAGIGMCDFYVRLGMMRFSTQVYVALYVRQSYCTKQIFDNIANNYQTIVEDLKLTVKNDDLHILELNVQPTVYVYSDDNVGPLRAAAAGTRNGIWFYIQ